MMVHEGCRKQQFEVDDGETIEVLMSEEVVWQDERYLLMKCLDCGVCSLIEKETGDMGMDEYPEVDNKWALAYIEAIKWDTEPTKDWAAMTADEAKAALVEIIQDEITDDGWTPFDLEYLFGDASYNLFRYPHRVPATEFTEGDNTPVPCEQHAGFIICPNCHSDTASVLRDADDEDWHTDCGDCDLLIPADVEFTFPVQIVEPTTVFVEMTYDGIFYHGYRGDVPTEVIAEGNDAVRIWLCEHGESMDYDYDAFDNIQFNGKRNVGDEE